MGPGSVTSKDVSLHLNARSRAKAKKAKGSGGSGSGSGRDKVSALGVQLRYVHDEPYNRSGPKAVLLLDPRTGKALKEYKSAQAAADAHGMPKV